MPDIAHRRLAQLPGAGDAQQIALDQRDARTFHRDIGAGTHRDADMGLGQRRSIVNAVAGHRDQSTCVLQLFDDFGFLFRQHFRFDPVYPELPGHGVGRCPVVSSQHDHFYAGFVQRFQGFRCRCLDGIGDTDEPCELAVGRDEHDGLSRQPKFVGLRF